MNYISFKVNEEIECFSKQFEFIHKLFEIKDLVNMILTNLTVGEIKYLGKQPMYRYSDEEILESVKSCLENDFRVIPYNMLSNHRITKDLQKKINNIVLRGNNKRNLIWLKKTGLLECNAYYDLIFDPEKVITYKLNAHIKNNSPYLWILLVIPNNFPDVEQFITANISIPLITDAAIHGHMHIVNFLTNTYIKKVTIDQLDTKWSNIINNYCENVKSKESFNWNFIKLAVDYGAKISYDVLTSISKFGDVLMFNYLEEKCKKIIFGNGCYEIAYAARHGNIDIIKYLISKKAPIDSDIFFWAAENNQFETIKFIFEQPSLNIYWSRFYINKKIVQIGNIQMIEYLIDKLYNGSYQTLLNYMEYIIKINDKKFLQFICDKIRKEKGISYKIPLNLDTEILKECDDETLELLKQNFEINDSNAYLPDILDTAATNNNLKLFKWIITNYCIPKDKLRPLESSIITELMENNISFQYLLELEDIYFKKGIPFLRVDSEWTDCLVPAIETQNKKVIKWILEKNDVIYDLDCLPILIRFCYFKTFKQTLNKQMKSKIDIDYNELIKQSILYKRKRITKYLKSIMTSIPTSIIEAHIQKTRISILNIVE